MEGEGGEKRGGKENQPAFLPSSGTEHFQEEAELEAIIRENFDLRPAGIIKMLDLRRPIYRPTAAYGHFGRTDLELPWEATDRVEELKKYLA